MMKKIFKVGHLRDLEKQVCKGEISYSRMVEILNEMANDAFQEVPNSETSVEKPLSSTPETESLGFYCESNSHGINCHRQCNFCKQEEDI